MAEGVSQPDLEQRAIDLLVELIRIKTVNPPGDERRLQELLKSDLEAAGMECKLVGAAPERQNLIATLKGDAPGRSLCYLGHVDTVLADPNNWSVDPWGGEIADGCIWGRGALDMKGQVAAEVAACVELARSGWRPASGELKLVLTCDEETGASLGAQWLCQTVPDEVRADIYINEGGGPLVPFGDRKLYALCVGEKGVMRFTLTTEGRAGHASTPAIADNALLKMAPILERLRDWQFELEPTAQADQLAAAFFGADGVGDWGVDPRSIVERARALDPRAALLLEPMLGMTAAPTMIRASEKLNVIPSQCKLKVDCRVPPGEGEEYVRTRIEQALAGEEFELRFDEQIEGNRSPADGEVAEAIAEFVDREDPGAGLAPVLLPGFTDSNWFRSAFDCVAYGFFPQRVMSVYDSMPLIHGADERIAIADLEYGARFFHYLAPRVLGSSG